MRRFAVGVSVLAGVLVVCGSASAALYVAMGDSVAAGAGLDPHPANSCDVSPLGYPGVVASDHHLTLVDLACAGATVPAGITGPQGRYPSQLARLFAAGDPEYVTITIGGNDINWDPAIQDCYQTNCGPDSLPSWLTADEQTLKSNLEGVLSDIGSHYPIPPTVILTGYEQLYTADYVCADEKGENPAVLAQAGAAVGDSLDNTIEQAAAGFSFAKFAQPDFAGHELCTPDPWVQGLTDPAPYHPTAEGQQEFAAVVDGVS